MIVEIMLHRLKVFLAAASLSVPLVIQAVFVSFAGVVLRIYRRLVVRFVPKFLFTFGHTTGPMKNDIIWSRLGSLYEHSGDFEKAAECFEKARKLNPTEAYYYWDLACVYEKQHKTDIAIENYEKALQTKNDFKEDFRTQLQGRIRKLKSSS